MPPAASPARPLLELPPQNPLDQLLRIGALPRPELLRPPAVHLRDVDVALGVTRDVMAAIEEPGLAAERPPVRLQNPLLVELQHPRRVAVEHPDHAGLVHANVIGIPDVRPQIEELAVEVEHLNARVLAIGHVDPLRINSEAVRVVELTGSLASRPPLHQVLPILRELDD